MSYRKFRMSRYSNKLVDDFSKAKTTSDKKGVYWRGFRTLAKSRHFADAEDQQQLSDTLTGMRTSLKEVHGVKGLPKPD